MYGHLRYSMDTRQRVVYDAAFTHARHMVTDKVRAMDIVDFERLSYEMMTRHFCQDEIVDIINRKMGTCDRQFRPYAGRELAFARLQGEYDGMHDAIRRYRRIYAARWYRRFER